MREAGSGGPATGEAPWAESEAVLAGLPGPGRAIAKKVGLIVLLLIAMHSGFLPRLKVRDVPLEFDSANYGTIASRMLGGEAYLATFNNKPPGIYWLYEAAIALVGRGAFACKLPTLACDMISLFLILFVGRRLLPRPGSLLTLAIYSTLFLPATIAAHGFAEFPVTLLTLAGVIVVLPRKGEQAFRFAPERATGLGLAIGLATLFKQPALFVLAGALAFALWSADEARWRAAGAVLVGWAVPVVGLLAWLAAAGEIGRFWSLVVEGGLTYGYAGAFPWSVKAAKMAEATLVQMPLFSLAALLVLVRALRRRRPFDKLLICFTLPTLLMAAGAYEFYGHYLLPALPFLCLAVSAAALEGRCRERAAVGLLLVSQVAILSVYLFAAKLPADLPGALARLAPKWEPRPLSLAYQMRAADYVREHLRPGERLISTNADIPFLAGLENSYRFPCIAPYIRSASGDGLADFPEAASRARFFWAEKWRLALLPEPFVAGLAGGAGWREIKDLEHPEFALYENLAPRNELIDRSG